MVLLKYMHGPVLLILHNIIYHLLEFALNKKGRKHPKNDTRTVKNAFWKYGDLAEYGNRETLPVVTFYIVRTSPLQ